MGSNSPPESFIESGGGWGIYTDTPICVAYLALPRPLFFTKIQDIDLYSKNKEHVCLLTCMFINMYLRLNTL